MPISYITICNTDDGMMYGINYEKYFCFFFLYRSLLLSLFSFYQKKVTSIFRALFGGGDSRDEGTSTPQDAPGAAAETKDTAQEEEKGVKDTEEPADESSQEISVRKGRGEREGTAVCGFLGVAVLF